eukprot:g1896.t1
MPEKDVPGEISIEKRESVAKKELEKSERWDKALTTWNRCDQKGPIFAITAYNGLNGKALTTDKKLSEKQNATKSIRPWIAFSGGGGSGAHGIQNFLCIVTLAPGTKHNKRVKFHAIVPKIDMGPNIPKTLTHTTDGKYLYIAIGSTILIYQMVDDQKPNEFSVRKVKTLQVDNTVKELTMMASNPFQFGVVFEDSFKLYTWTKSIVAEKSSPDVSMIVKMNVHKALCSSCYGWNWLIAAGKSGGKATLRLWVRSLEEDGWQIENSSKSDSTSLNHQLIDCAIVRLSEIYTMNLDSNGKTVLTRSTIRPNLIAKSAAHLKNKDSVVTNHNSILRNAMLFLDEEGGSSLAVTCSKSREGREWVACGFCSGKVFIIRGEFSYGNPCANLNAQETSIRTRGTMSVFYTFNNTAIHSLPSTALAWSRHCQDGELVLISGSADHSTVLVPLRFAIEQNGGLDSFNAFAIIGRIIRILVIVCLTLGMVIYLFMLFTTEEEQIAVLENLLGFVFDVKNLKDAHRQLHLIQEQVQR